MNSRTCSENPLENSMSQQFIKLHVGGKQPKHDWKILNIQFGPNVDILGSCTDLSALEDESVIEIYASHVLEHLSYRLELPKALSEFYRVLIPGGKVSISLPDLDILLDIYRDPKVSFNQKWLAISMMFGGQKDENDIHKLGANYELMKMWLENAGFSSVERVKQFDYFDDSSKTVLCDRFISLNLSAIK